VLCQLDGIEGYMRLILIRKSLKSLPKTLDETYARILNGIPEECTEDVRRIMCCLICSFYPFDIQEVADTVASGTEGQPYYDADNRLSGPRNILTICSGLVTTTMSKRKVFDGEGWVDIEELRLTSLSKNTSYQIA